MEEPCRHPDAADPFVSFHSMVDLADCSQQLLPLDQMERAPEAETAMLNLVAPPTGATADEQLEPSINPILTSKPYKKDGLVVIVRQRARGARAVAVRRGGQHERQAL